MKDFKSFQLKKAEYENIFGGNVAPGSYYNTYAKSDKDHSGSTWNDYVD
jgi:hypothetical protein